MAFSWPCFAILQTFSAKKRVELRIPPIAFLCQNGIRKIVFYERRYNVKLTRILQLLIVASLLFAVGGSPPQTASAAKAQPQLVQMAAEKPDALVRVIAQKTAGAEGVEALVSKLGGRVTSDLHFINAFAAEMTAEAAIKLAQMESVRWVSLDAKMNSATANQFTTWATADGTVVANAFTNNAMMFDSSLGSNGTYGYGANVKGAFTGFAGQAVPGNAITKVELVIKGYAPVALPSAQDPKIYPYVDGVAGKMVLLNHHAFDTYVGAANAGVIYLDITSSRTWQWADFESDLQIMIDQSRFKSTTLIYYDAVGLRVTSAPGTDNSLDGLTDTTQPDFYIDPSQQVNVYNQVIGASKLWNTASKLQGNQVGVAVVDSGVAKVKDLKVKEAVNFNASYHDSSDRYGHGTFVAGLIGGNGASSNGLYIGVAPKTTIYNVRVSDDNGMSYTSDVIESLQWIYENKDKTKIRVVNLSLNQSVAESYHTSPLDAAVEILWFNGVVVVVSAGNNGTTTLYPPANDPFVITVGATDDRGTLSLSDDMVTTFSAYGMTADGFAKPDLVAPGHDIVGLLPENDKLNIGIGHPNNRVNATYFRMSGTSMSAPMVSGAVAILLQDEPNLTPDQVKYRLMATANKKWAGYNATSAGAGYLDIYAAVYGNSTQSANTGVLASKMLSTGSNPITWNSIGWNSVGWNSVGWNSVGWNSVGWNSVGWNSVGWNSDYWDQ
jgi:serine protease AprX